MDIQLPQIIFQIINFSVVMGALTYLLYKPIQKIMDERVSKIKEGQEAAQAAIDEKHNLTELKSKIEHEAERKAANLVDEAVKRATKQQHEIVERAKSEAKAEVEKLQADWKMEHAQLITAARQEMVDAIMAVSAKVIDKKLDEKTEGAFISRELDKVFGK